MYNFFQNLNNVCFQNRSFVNLLFLRVMRNARPFLLVALYLTAYAGYFFYCIIACRSFVLSLLLLSLEANVLIAQFRYFKIQRKTINITARLRGINPTNSIVFFRSLVLRSIV